MLTGLRTVVVHPPPASCTSPTTQRGSSSADDSVCNPIQTAVDSAPSHLRVVISAGTYTNRGYASGKKDNPTLVKVVNKQFLELVAAPGGAMPKLLFDGDGAIKIIGSSHVRVSGLEIQGPAARISGADASRNRLRMTSRSAGGGRTGLCGPMECSSCLQRGRCTATSYCRWKQNGFCEPKPLSYFNAPGVSAWPRGVSKPHHISIEGNRVHHCGGSGVRANQADDSEIASNLVYDNCWWTHSASSGIVFAEAQGTGVNSIENNVVLAGGVGKGTIKDYSTWRQNYIIDGSGVYITRNQQYRGTMRLVGNIAYDNGINGVVVHRTNNPSVRVLCANNLVFGNGKTTRDVESRQDAGGLIINNGIHVTLANNVVSTSDSCDFAFQCFGQCGLSPSGSSGNVYCSGKVAKAFPSRVFASRKATCSRLTGLRTKYPPSTAPTTPQYTLFTQSTKTQRAVCQSTGDSINIGTTSCQDFSAINQACPTHGQGALVPRLCNDPSDTRDDRCARIFIAWYKRCFTDTSFSATLSSQLSSFYRDCKQGAQGYSAGGH